MKRFATLALVVFALAAVPAAFADDTTPPRGPRHDGDRAGDTPTQQRQNGGAGNARMRVELLRLRLQIVKLRFRLHCGPNGKAPADKCHAASRSRSLDAPAEDRRATCRRSSPS